MTPVWVLWLLNAACFFCVVYMTFDSYRTWKTIRAQAEELGWLLEQFNRAIETIPEMVSLKVDKKIAELFDE